MNQLLIETDVGNASILLYWKVISGVKPNELAIIVWNLGFISLVTKMIVLRSSQEES